jgi:hypothetical protein
MFLSQIKNAVEAHSSKLEQVEDRISDHKNKTDIKEKTEEFLDENSKATKVLYKNSVTPSKDQT